MEEGKEDRQEKATKDTSSSLHNLSHVFMKHSEGLIMLACNEHLSAISHSFKLEGTIIFIAAN